LIFKDEKKPNASKVNIFGHTRKNMGADQEVI
jgi:hypothetical protein